MAAQKRGQSGRALRELSRLMAWSWDSRQGAGCEGGAPGAGGTRAWC